MDGAPASTAALQSWPKFDVFRKKAFPSPVHLSLPKTAARTAAVWHVLLSSARSQEAMQALHILRVSVTSTEELLLPLCPPIQNARHGPMHARFKHAA